MAQAVVQEGTDNFGDTTTATVAFTGCVAGNYLEVRSFTWGDNSSPNITITDNGGASVDAWATAVSAELTDLGNNIAAEVFYAKVASNGNFTLTATHAGDAGARYGWIWAGEISGRKATTPLIAAVTNSASSSLGSTTPAVSGAGATGAVECLVIGVLAVSTASASIGIDAATGSSLTWTNQIQKQDGSAEMAGSADDAPSTTSITPSVAWGTLASSEEWVAGIVAFEDAGAAPSTTTGGLASGGRLARGILRGSLTG